MCERMADSIVKTKRAGLCTHTYAEAEQRKLIDAVAMVRFVQDNRIKKILSGLDPIKFVVAG